MWFHSVQSSCLPFISVLILINECWPTRWIRYSLISRLVVFWIVFFMKVPLHFYWNEYSFCITIVYYMTSMCFFLAFFCYSKFCMPGMLFCWLFRKFHLVPIKIRAVEIPLVSLSFIHWMPIMNSSWEYKQLKKEFLSKISCILVRKIDLTVNHCLLYFRS